MFFTYDTLASRQLLGFSTPSSGEAAGASPLSLASLVFPS